MSNIRCFIITDFISEVASKLNISAERAANLAALYQSRNPKDGEITFEKISKIFFQERENTAQLDTLIPMYQTIEYDSSATKLASHDQEGNIVLMQLPKENWKSIFMHLLDRSPNRQEIDKQVVSREDAYRFILWREMFYVQRGVAENNINARFAERSSLEKLSTYKRLQAEGLISQKEKPKTEENTEQPSKTIQYTPKGKNQQTYTIKGTKIFNASGKEVFKEDSVDRNKMFAKLAIKEGRAVVVSYKDTKYIVNNRGDILSVATGKIMQWGEENGDRRSIIALAQDKFIANQDKSTSFSQQTVDSNQINTNTTTTDITSQEIALKNLKKELEKIISVGRNGYISVLEKDDILRLSTYSSGDDVTYKYLYKLDDSGNLFTYSNWTSDFPKSLEEIEWAEVSPEKMTEQDKLIFNYLNQRYSQNLQINQKPQVEIFSGNWSREEVAKQTDKVFLFGDNTNDRINTHYVPTMTQAVIRGLPNAIGIDTKKNRNTSEESYFTDADFDTFKDQVDKAIQQAVNSGKTIVIPEGGIGTGKAQLQQRAPKLFNYLQEQLNKLQLRDTENYNEQKLIPTEVTNHSGGAYGADTLWDTIGRRFGVVNHKHYRDSGNTKLSNTLSKSGVTATVLSSEQMETARTELKKLLGILYPDTIEGNLQVRNYYQVINSDAVYAIATLNEDKTGVTGGTNTAVQLGIKLNKSVYVWDINTESWYKFDGKQFILTNTPTLTKNFAGVGTRDIENYNVYNKETKTWEPRKQYVGDDKANKAKKAIQDVYNETFKDVVSTQETIQEDLNVIDELPQNVSSNNVIRSFIASTAAQPQKQLQEDPVEEDLPTPGIEVLTINKENPLAQLYQDLNSAQRRDRTVMLQEVFSEIVSREIRKKIKQLNAELNAENIKETPNQDKVNKINRQIASYQDSAKGRKRFIQDTPIRELFDLVKKEIEDYKDEAETEYELDAYEKVLIHFNILMTNACSLIEFSEGIRIIPDIVYHNNGETLNKTLGGTVTATTQEQEDLESQTEDDPEGNRATGNDGWSFKIREVDLRTTISQKVKKVLSEIPLSGDFSTDDLGRQRYLNFNTAHAILINELSEMVTPEDFYNPEGKNIASKFPALTKMIAKYSWAKSLRSKLNSDPILLTQFFVDFRKDFAPFIKIKLGTLIDLNAPVAIDSVITKINRNYEQGILLDKDSLYNQSLGIRKESKSIGLQLIKEIKDQIDEEDELSKEQEKLISKDVVKLLRMLGYNATEKTIKNIISEEEDLNKLHNLITNISTIFDNIDGVPEDGSIHLINNAFKTPYTNIAEIIGEIDDLDNLQTFREGGKDRPSYVAPNYIGTLIKKLKRDDLRKDVLQSEFKNYEFFYDKTKNKWKTKWLELIEKDKKVRDKLRLVELKHIQNELLTKEYEDWTPTDIRVAFVIAHFAEGVQSDYGYFHMPIFSDSPINMMIRFKKYNSNYEEQLTPLFRQLVYQELERIKLVNERKKLIAEGKVKAIVNFDKNGGKFNFIPYLNEYEENGKSFLQLVTELQKDFNSTELNKLIDRAIKDYMEKEYEDFVDNLEEQGINSIIEAFQNNPEKGFPTTIDDILPLLRQYIWNSEFATSQIIQLTVTDPAFFKDDIDFQKRFKQVYAAGNKLNTNSKYGRKVEKAVYLADLEMLSQTFTGVKNIFRKAVKEKRISSAVAKGIISKFKKINATDAQAFRSISSLRSVYDMMGMWTDEMQTAVENFEKGTWTGEDFDVVWQTIKPFMYTQISKPSGRENQNIKVPHQNKNSEFLLLATFNYIAAATSESPKLRALTRFMEANEIDVVMFESAVKCGGQGIIDINYSEDKLTKFINNDGRWSDIDAAAKKELGKKYNSASNFEKFKAGNDYLLDNDKITQEQYNNIFDIIDLTEQETLDVLNNNIRLDDGQFDPEVVHQMSYNDYVVQQPTPEHLFDAVAKYGSQFRNLIISDLPSDFKVVINGKEYDKKSLIDLYDALIVENLLDDFETVKKTFGSMEALQQDLLNKVKGNPKYGREFTDALQLIPHPTDPNKKVFNLPPSSPSITEKFQELILSVFKNKITKQEIKGGNAILVSNFGLTKKLKIEYNEDGSIKGVQCYLPAYSKKFYEPFINKSTGELEIEKMPDDLKKIIGYRIPTEGKYSMVPLIIKGFLPQQNGSAIMLPADITAIAGSDFDVDKLFLMIPEFREVVKYNHKLANQDFFKENPDAWSKTKKAQKESFLESYQKLLETNPQLADEIDPKDVNFLKWFVKESGIRKTEWDQEVAKQYHAWFKKNKNKYIISKTVRKIEYETGLPQDNSREARNNMLIDISYSILTHPSIALDAISPGNFDTLKLADRKAQLLNDIYLLEKFVQKYNLKDRKEIINKILNIQLDEINDFIKEFSRVRSLLSPETFIHFHQQNMAGAKLIGMYANNTIAQAKFQSSDLRIADFYVFKINGRDIHSLHEIRSDLNEQISKNCAETSAASVDNAKDPVLAGLKQNPKTANILGTLLRAGVTIEEAGLLFSIPQIRSIIDQYGDISPTTIKNVLANMMQLNYYDKAFADALKSLKQLVANTNFTSEFLIEHILEYDEINHNQNKLLILALMLNISEISEFTGEVTRNSRADSPNGALQNSIESAILQNERVGRLRKLAGSKDAVIKGLNSSWIRPSEILVDINATKDQLREKILESRMPKLQAFYTLGIDLPVILIGDLFVQTNPLVLSMVRDILNNRSNLLSDSTLKNINKSFITYLLSKTKLFGDTPEISLEKKREYYLNKFPEKFLKLKEENPDIASIGAIEKLTVSYGKLVMERSSRLSQTDREMFMSDFDSLLYHENPVAQKLAVDLLLYSYYNEGLSFGPNSFGNFFSPTFYNAFDELVNTLRTISDNITQEEINKFRSQLYANIGGVLAQYVKVDTDNADEILLDDKLVRNTVIGGASRWSYISTSDGVYVLDSSRSNSEKAMYVRIDSLNSWYNANKEISEMLQYNNFVELKSTTQQNSSEESSDEVYEMDDILNMLDSLEQDDTYSEDEGNQQLQEPLC